MLRFVNEVCTEGARSEVKETTIVSVCVTKKRGGSEIGGGNPSFEIEKDLLNVSNETMRWLRLVGSLKLWVSLAEYCLFYRALSQKRHIILRSPLVVATSYRREHLHLRKKMGFRRKTRRNPQN